MATPTRPPPDPGAVRWFPDDLEAALVAQAHARAPRSTPAEAVDRLWRAAAALSDLFTTARPARFPDYAADEDLRLAYGLYFAPQTWVRARFPLAEAVDARGWRPPAGRPVRILDLGAGLGAAGWSVAQWCVARRLAPSAELIALDRSRAALSALERLWGDGLPATKGVALTTRTGDLADPGWPAAAGKAPDVVVLSFALNEAFPAGEEAPAQTFLESARELLAPDGLLLAIEPALRETATRLRTLAAPLVAAARWHVVAPDLCDRVAPAHPDPRFFDHEVRRWRPPACVRAINRRLARSLDELTFSFVALSPTGPTPFPPSPRRTRLTSPLARLKGRLACTGTDTDGARSTYDLLERHLTDADRRRLARVERGDHVALSEAEPLREPGWFRVPRPEAFQVAWHPD